MTRHVPTAIEGEPLPEVLARVAEACGVGAALALASAYGGREMWVPKPENIAEDHPLALALGLACARRAADVLGSGGRLLIPLGPTSTPQRRREAIRRMKAEGRSNPSIARALGIHLRTVERRVAQERLGDDDEPDLFG